MKLVNYMQGTSDALGKNKLGFSACSVLTRVCEPPQIHLYPSAMGSPLRQRSTCPPVLMACSKHIQHGVRVTTPKWAYEAEKTGIYSLSGSNDTQNCVQVMGSWDFISSYSSDERSTWNFNTSFSGTMSKYESPGHKVQSFFYLTTVRLLRDRAYTSVRKCQRHSGMGMTGMTGD